MLKLCLMKYGVGKWVQILETGLLPGKLIQQLNGQAQRLLGQQSLAGRALHSQRVLRSSVRCTNIFPYRKSVASVPLYSGLL